MKRQNGELKGSISHSKEGNIVIVVEGVPNVDLNTLFSLIPAVFSIPSLAAPASLSALLPLPNSNLLPQNPPLLPKIPPPLFALPSNPSLALPIPATPQRSPLCPPGKKPPLLPPPAVNLCSICSSPPPSLPIPPGFVPRGFFDVFPRQRSALDGGRVYCL